MLDDCYGCALFAVLAVVAGVLLALRDARRNREKPERPIAEQIEEIHKGAASMIPGLQEILDRNPTPWVAPVLDYYRRLESLASSPNASVEEAERLADEVSEYVREHKIKGIHIGHEARRLAVLLRQRQGSR